MKAHDIVPAIVAAWILLVGHALWISCIVGGIVVGQWFVVVVGIVMSVPIVGITIAAFSEWRNNEQR